MNQSIATAFSFIKRELCLLFALFFLIISNAISAPLDKPVYNNLKQNFLNIHRDPSTGNYLYTEHDFNAMANDPTQNNLGSGANQIGFKLEVDGGFKGKWWHGAPLWCNNQTHGTKSLCWYAVGGSPENQGKICGSSVGGNYDFALTCSTCVCSPGQWAPDSGLRLWIGVRDNTSFILNNFNEIKNGPANRMCFEVEVPEDRVRANLIPGESPAVVNRGVSHDNLDNLRFHFGTYTSPYLSENGTIDEEVGGTFNGGDTHFYHNTSNIYPLDKAYALNPNTFVTCMVPAPSAIRSGSRPPFYLNPLMTVVGENEEGLTDAYEYVPYLTRVYFEHWASQAQYPYTVKINKAFMAYEENEIFAMSRGGEVLGVNMIVEGGTAQYPFTIYNKASVDRSYRLQMIAEGNVIMIGSQPGLKLFVDTNGNRKLEPNETTEFISGGVYTFKANTDQHLIAVHKPDFADTIKFLYNHFFAPASITFQEESRLRLASYAIRTWKGTTDEVADRNTFLESVKYQSPDSAYKTKAQWNQDKPNNTRLVRESPDFKMARQKYLSRPADNTPPQAPGGIQGVALPNNKIKISWNEAIETDGWVDHYDVYRNGQKIASLGGKYPSLTYTDSTVIGSTSYSYKVKAVNGSGGESVFSSTVDITTLSDQVAPQIFSAWVGIDQPNKLVLGFSERMSKTSVETISNYQLNASGINILGITLDADEKTAVITVNTPFVNAPYTITINNVQDHATPANKIAPNTTMDFTLPALVDFAGKVEENFYGLKDWTIQLNDNYTTNTPLGPEGMSSNIRHTGGYDYAGVRGPERLFTQGQVIRAHFYNNSDAPITFTPKINFTYEGQIDQMPQAWYSMSKITIAPFSISISTYQFTSASAGNYEIISISNQYDDIRSNIAILDKIELRMGNSSETVAPTVPTSLRITAVAHDSLTLTWNPSTDNIGVMGYELELDTKNDFSTAKKRFVSSTTQTKLIGLTALTNYFIRMRAVDTSGNYSTMSTAATGRTNSAPANPPPDGNNPPPDETNPPANPADELPVRNIASPGQPAIIPCHGEPRITIYTRKGDFIEDLTCNQNGQAVWDAKNMASGLYYVGHKRKKIVVIK